MGLAIGPGAVRNLHLKRTSRLRRKTAGMRQIADEGRKEARAITECTAANIRQGLPRGHVVMRHLNGQTAARYGSRDTLAL
jgi:hypothetical protein